MIRLMAAVLLAAQTASPPTHAPATTFHARLSPLPVDQSTAAKITGTGSVTATLEGSRLVIAGTFEGMKSSATIAQIRMGQRGVRGPVAFDLRIDRSPKGRVTGTITLTDIQVDTLRRGWYYVQIHAEQAPEGNLWGWLLPDER